MKNIKRGVLVLFLTVVLAGCGDIALRDIISRYVESAGPAIQVGSIANSRIGGGKTLDGSFMADARDKLLNLDNFSSEGTVKKVVVITDIKSAITAAVLSDLDVLFIGLVPDGTFSGAELLAMRDWVSSGGVMIITADDSTHDAVAETFGYPTLGPGLDHTVGVKTNYIIPSQNNAAALTHRIFAGPFGSITSSTSVFEGGDVGTMALYPYDLGWDFDPGFYWYVMGELPYGTGRVILLTDVDLLTNSNSQMSSGDKIRSTFGNDVFLGNLFAYAHKDDPTYYGHHDQLPNPDFPSAGFLWGEQVYVSGNSTLWGFGCVVQAGNGSNVKMALYTDSGGVPSTLVASTPAAILNDGRTEIAGNGASLAPGYYWIMAIFDGTPTTYIDTTSTNSYYVNQPFTNAPPVTMVSPVAFSYFHFNYYIITH